jgi:hypothetical protein
MRDIVAPGREFLLFSLPRKAFGHHQRLITMARRIPASRMVVTQ